MAHSPGSAQRRAHLIREMSRQGERSNGTASVGSSAGSVQNEFLVYDTESQQLPPLRSEQDFQVNTSALRRAFPDFSNNGSSEEDSIEMGRGLKRSGKNAPSRDFDSEDVTENMPFTFGNGGKYRITGTPPIKPRHANRKTVTAPATNVATNEHSKYAQSEKENDEGAKETRYGSASSRENDNADRKASDLRARVESDDSVSVSDGRLQAVNMPTRNTRFGNRRAKQALYNEKLLRNETSASLASGANGTAQSFVLPNMPNITELISGIRQDGTPLFTRSIKSRSRFFTPSQNRHPKQAHLSVENAPIPTDEKALYVSLQLLREKVAALELEKTHSEKKLDDYELEVLQLKSKLEEIEHVRNSDSGIGTDQDDAKAKDVHSEKSQLELSIKTLQDRLERTNRNVSKSEVIIQNLTKDRDTAHQQLALAFLNSEELKNESQAMRDELKNIRAQVTKINRDHEKKISYLTQQETELRAKIDRREKAINEMSSLAKELWQTRNALAAASASSHIALSLPNQLPEQLKIKKNRISSYPTEPKPPKLSTTETYSDYNPRTVSKSTAATGDTSRRHRVTNIQRPTYDSEDDAAASNVDSTTNITVPHASNANEPTKNSTYMSFMEGDEVAKLRRIVEEDKARLTLSRAERPIFPRKSSLKKVQYEDDPSHRSGDYATTVRDNTFEDIPETIRGARGERQNKQQLSANQLSERRIQDPTIVESDITSAFILPDITLTSAALDAHRAGQGNENIKETISISRPIPVSDRIPASTDGELDVTIRPAQSPALALAIVLKGLENELAELRAQLADQESIYHKHDPALSKKIRKVVYTRIQKLLAAIEIRADQIYALYDVLEGQKANRQTMKEAEVELTLQNIIINPAPIYTAGKATMKAKTFHSVDDEDEASESDDNREHSEELPWEGFEPTQTQTLENVARLSSRR